MRSPTVALQRCRRSDTPLHGASKSGSSYGKKTTSRCASEALISCTMHFRSLEPPKTPVEKQYRYIKESPQYCGCSNPHLLPSALLRLAWWLWGRIHRGRGSPRTPCSARGSHAAVRTAPAVKHAKSVKPEKGKSCSFSPLLSSLTLFLRYWFCRASMAVR